LLYLNQNDYDLDAAVLAFRDDEEWERQHPIDASSNSNNKGKAKDIPRRRKYGVSAGISGQL